MFRLFRLDPPHGWRAVWWELAIVTLGVLIALVAQQWADASSWRGRVVEQKVRLTAEIQGHYANAAELLVVAPCIDQQLARLSRLLARPGARPPVYREKGAQFLFRNPERAWTDDAWRTAIGDGTSAHMDPAFAAIMSQHYGNAEQMRELRDKLSDVDGPLNVILELGPSNNRAALRAGPECSGRTAMVHSAGGSRHYNGKGDRRRGAAAGSEASCEQTRQLGHHSLLPFARFPARHFCDCHPEMIVLGLDPGLGTTGWGVILAEGNRLAHIANGRIATRAADPLPARLAYLGWTA